MADDAQLLHEFVAGSESAFARLMERHLTLVFSSALRRAEGNAALAEDVTQAVFVLLAQRSRQLCHHPSLAGWLYETAQFKVAEFRRAERRRRVREEAAHIMHQLLTDTRAAAWEQIRPILDEAMLDLNRSDREVVLLRFFAALPFSEIAARLLLTETTAHKRVERALEKLRLKLARRGVTSSASALAAVLGAQSAAAAPAGLAGTIITAVGGVALCGPASSFLGTIILMTTTQKTIAAAALLACLATGGALFYDWSANRLISERNALEGERGTIRGELQARTKDSVRSSTDLAQGRDVIHGTLPPPAESPAAAVPTLTAAIEAEQMRLFLAVEWSKLAGGALPLVAKLGLTPNQLARYSAMAARELEGTYPPGPMALDRYKTALQEKWASETRELIGDERFQQLQKLQTAEARLKSLAKYLGYWDAGFTSQQSNQLLQWFATDETLLRNGNGALSNELVARLEQILSPQQIELWRRYHTLADTQQQLTELLRSKEAATGSKPNG